MEEVDNYLQMLSAKNIAVLWHWGQMYGDRPYIEHLESVATKVYALYESKDISLAYKLSTIAYLHDILEDTNVKEDVLVFNFSDDIVNAVKLITMDKSLKNRKEKLQDFYNRIELDKRKNKLALIVKAADRLSNWENAIETNKINLIKMYMSEADAFSKFIYVEGLCDSIWYELDDLYDKSNGIIYYNDV